MDHFLPSVRKLPLRRGRRGLDPSWTVKGNGKGGGVTRNTERARENQAKEEKQNGKKEKEGESK